MTTLSEKLNQATKVHAMTNEPVQHSHGIHSVEPLNVMAAKKLKEELDAVKKTVDSDNVPQLQKLLNTMVNGVNGVKLFECNAMQICLLANGELADTALPFGPTSVLTVRDPQYIVEKYGVKDCLAELHKAFDNLLAHEIKVHNDNREVVGLPRIDPSLLV